MWLNKYGWSSKLSCNVMNRHRFLQTDLVDTTPSRAPEQMKSFAGLQCWETEAPLEHQKENM